MLHGPCTPMRMHASPPFSHAGAPPLPELQLPSRLADADLWLRELDIMVESLHGCTQMRRFEL